LWTIQYYFQIRAIIIYNMSPDQKRWNDRFISIITLALLALLALIVAAFLINEIRLSNSYKFFGSQTDIERVRILTTEDVANERILLPPRSNLFSDVGLNQATSSEITGRSSQINDSDLAELRARSTVANSQPPTLSADSLTSQFSIEQNGSLVAQVEVHSLSDGPVEVRSVGINQLQQNNSPISVEGIVFSKSANSITVTNPSYGSVNVLFNTNTRFAINGKPMSPNDLLIGDIILAEGLGSFEGREIEASVVLLVGKVDIFMPI